MATAEERMQILKMVQEKQISAEDGARLLTALNSASPEEGTSQDKEPKTRWLRVRITDSETGKVKASVNIPTGLVDVGLKMGARFAPDVADMDMSTLQAAIKEGMSGKIVDVEDHEKHERVEIFVE